MNIPLNGRVAIVDDRYLEVKPLMDFLSKKRIPFNYYSGEGKNLPEDSFTNPVFLLFLDLNIIETQHNVKTVISTLHPILKALCPGQSIPYFLIMWSKKINDFANQLENHFQSNSDLKNRRPVKFIRLNKSDFFDVVDGEYVFNDEKYSLLIETLNNELENVSILKNLLLWENIIHQQTKDTITEFSSLYPVDEDWDKNMKALIFHLAKAILGDESVKIASEDDKLRLGFSAVNSFLFDKIEHATLDKALGSIVGVSDDLFNEKKNKEGRLSTAIRGRINSKLHLATNNLNIDSFEQGNVYKVRSDNKLINKILDKKNYNNIKTEDIINSKPILVQIDLTPVCDYSQDKNYTRLIHGLLIDANFSGMAIRNAYQRQTPTFNINNKEKFLIIDYRFLQTMNKEEIKKRKRAPFIRLRKEICTDIQSQLSNQVNRPGISNV